MRVWYLLGGVFATLIHARPIFIEQVSLLSSGRFGLKEEQLIISPLDSQKL